MLDCATLAIFGCEDDGAGLAERLSLLPAKDTLGTQTPESDAVLCVEQEHGEIACALDEQAEALVTFPPCGFGLLQILDIGSGAEPSDNLTVRATQWHIAPDVPAIHAVGAPQPIFGIEHAACCQGPLPALDRGGRIVGMHDHLPAEHSRFMVAQAAVVVPALIEVVCPAIGVVRPD